MIRRTFLCLFGCTCVVKCKAWPSDLYLPAAEGDVLAILRIVAAAQRWRKDTMTNLHWQTQPTTRTQPHFTGRKIRHGDEFACFLMLWDRMIGDNLMQRSREIWWWLEAEVPCPFPKPAYVSKAYYFFMHTAPTTHPCYSGFLPSHTPSFLPVPLHLACHLFDTEGMFSANIFLPYLCSFACHTLYCTALTYSNLPAQNHPPPPASWLPAYWVEMNILGAGRGFLRWWGRAKNHPHSLSHVHLNCTNVVKTAAIKTKSCNA